MGVCPVSEFCRTQLLFETWLRSTCQSVVSGTTLSCVRNGGTWGRGTRMCATVVASPQLHRATPSTHTHTHAQLHAFLHSGMDRDPLPARLLNVVLLLRTLQ